MCRLTGGPTTRRGIRSLSPVGVGSVATGGASDHARRRRPRLIGTPWSRDGRGALAPCRGFCRSWSGGTRIRPDHSVQTTRTRRHGLAPPPPLANIEPWTLTTAGKHDDTVSGVAVPRTRQGGVPGDEGAAGTHEADLERYYTSVSLRRCCLICAGGR